MADPMGSRMPPATPGGPNASEPPRGPQWRLPPGGGSGWGGWMVLGLIMMAFWGWRFLQPKDAEHPQISYTQFYKEAEAQRVKEVTLRGQEVRGKFSAPVDIAGKKLEQFRTMVPSQTDEKLLPLLREKGVN